MSNRLFRKILTLLPVALIALLVVGVDSLAGTTPLAATVTGAAVPIQAATTARPADPVAGQPGQVSAKSSRAELKAEGYDPSDIESALFLQEDTGIPAHTALAERKLGKTWPQIFEEQTRGLTASDHKSTPNTAPPLDLELVRKYVNQGFARADVLDAISLAGEYGQDLDEVLRMKTPAVTWGEVRTQILRKILPGPTPPPGRPRMQFDGKDTTNSGLTQDQVWALVDQGYTLVDILHADHLAVDLGEKVTDLLAKYRTGLTWEEVRSGIVQHRADALTLGVTPTKVTEYYKSGFSRDELLRAAHEVRMNGGTLDAVLQKYLSVGRDWQKVGPERSRKITRFEYFIHVNPDGTQVKVDRSVSGLTVEEVNTLLQSFPWEDVELADLRAARFGADARQLLALRQSGRTWDEIELELELALREPPHPPEPVDATLVEVLKELGVADNFADTAEISLSKTEVEALRAQGFDEHDRMYAAVIAKVTGQPALEVAKGKTAGSTWPEVARALGRGVLY